MNYSWRHQLLLPLLSRLGRARNNTIANMATIHTPFPQESEPLITHRNDSYRSYGVRSLERYRYPIYTLPRLTANSTRHAQMIALGGTIGTGLFVGSGQTLARGGPAFIVGCYCFMSFLVICVVSGIVEIAAYLPTPGSSMNLFGYRYVSRSMGFALGWLYFYSLGILVPYEITAAGLVIDYWNAPVNIAVWISIMIVVIVGLNVLPVKFYGETEFWFAGTKVVMMVGLIMVSIVLCTYYPELNLSCKL
jgi:hypothetical protein